MKKSSSFSFQSTLERISTKMDYFAIAVPPKVSEALKTKGPVPVFAQVNGSTEFLVSLFPVGKGRHYLRVKLAIRKEVQVEEGDRVRVKIEVRDRTKEISVPKDVAAALKAEGMTKAFAQLPMGEKSFILRKIEEAAKPDTRVKRIDAAIAAASCRQDKIKS